MAYIGFDLDETLGKFSVADAYVYFFMPQALYTGLWKGYSFPVPSPQLQRNLQAAFQTFAECLASKEPELGLLRPGMVQIFNKLADFKQSGKVHGMLVYSNNGNLALLVLATKMIEYLVGKGPLFCNHIDYYNEMRGIANIKTKPGLATKTTQVLRQSFVDPRCGNATSINDVPIDKLFFFDDMIHSNIKSSIGDRYFQVAPYKKDPNYQPITECFDMAIKRQGLDIDEEYLNYIKPIANPSTSSPISYSDILNFIHNYNTGYPLKHQVFNDDTDEILDTLEHLFSSSAGGFRKRKTIKTRLNKSRRHRIIKKLRGSTLKR